jgi:hypothetical protein
MHSRTPKPCIMSCRSAVPPQVLAAAEERERRLVAAEEAAARRRREQDREHAARLAEAEAAVRRLQVQGAGTWTGYGPHGVW